MKNLLYITAGNMAKAGVQTCIYNWVKYSGRLLTEFHISWYCPGRVWEDTFYNEIKSLEIEIIIGDNGIKNYYCFWRDICNLLKEKHFDIVHINTGSKIHTYIALKEAYGYQVPVRIAHSHSVSSGANRWKNAIYTELQKRIRRLCTQMLACSREAGVSLFGTDKDVIIINNGIEIEKYTFDAEIRKKLREEESISDNCKVYIMVANLVPVKNHSFLIDVFKNIKKTEPDSILWIVGKGPLLDILRKKARDCGLESSIVFLGMRNDVNRLLQAADAFILTSFTEGFPFASLEAQTAGLVSFLSNGVSQSAKVTKLVHFINIEEGAEKWAEMIISTVSGNYFNRLVCAELVAKAGYDVKKNVCVLEKLYLEGLNIYEA